MRVSEAGWLWSIVRQTVLVSDASAVPAPSGASSTRGGPLWYPPADVYSTGDSWWITLALPGVSRASLEFEMRDGALHIRATREAPWRKALSNPQERVRLFTVPVARRDRKTRSSFTRQT